MLKLGVFEKTKTDEDLVSKRLRKGKADADRLLRVQGGATGAGGHKHRRHPLLLPLRRCGGCFVLAILVRPVLPTIFSIPSQLVLVCHARADIPCLE